MTPRRLAVLTRGDCELCTALLGLLEPYVIAGRVTLELREFDAEPLAERERQQWRIPVLFEDARELTWGRIDGTELARLLGDPPVGG